MKFSLLAAPLALIVAGPAVAQVMAPAEYVKTAGASDLFERQSAQTVLDTTTDPRIREFATMMISAHTQSTNDVKVAAARSRVSAPPAMLNPLQQELITELKAETGAARDATYIAQQKASHNQALFVQQAYATEGRAPALKAAAAKIVPVVQQHIAMLMQM